MRARAVSNVSRYNYRRIKFGQKSESFSGEQRELFEETVNTDLAAIEAGPEGKRLAHP